MAVTTVYTDLEMPQGPGGIPQLPKPPGRRWYWAILGAGWVGAAVLAGIVLWLLQRHGERRGAVGWGEDKSNPPQKPWQLRISPVFRARKQLLAPPGCFFCGFDACAATNPCSPRQHLAPSHPEGGSAQGFHPAACNPGVKPIPPPLISDGNSLNPTGSCSWEPCPGKGTSSSNRSLNCFQLGLRERLCEAESHQAPGAEGCWLCPTGWQPFATKCYRISAKTLPWNEAGGDCKDRRAELVMLKSVEEKDFIGAMSKEIAGSWTGLSTIPTQGEGWTWMDGSPLQDDLLQVMGERRVNACASMWKGQLRSHTCGTPLHWICQKEATKI
uniref:C-type lectin domain-containing protein n=1 Tax=Anser brachyrhynchus TaxID=132585 RepID=A0A8B9BI30_9AVES